MDHETFYGRASQKLSAFVKSAKNHNKYFQQKLKIFNFFPGWIVSSSLDRRLHSRWWQAVLVRLESNHQGQTCSNSALEIEWCRFCTWCFIAVRSKENSFCWWSSKAVESWWVVCISPAAVHDACNVVSNTNSDFMPKTAYTLTQVPNRWAALIIDLWLLLALFTFLNE